MAQTRSILLASLLLGLCVGTNPAAAQKKYDPGATDSEIKIGNIMPYSGPLSAYKLVGRTQDAFFKKLNAEGGINGRKINFISYDDAYSPPKTVEHARKLVESDEVLLITELSAARGWLSSLRSAPNYSPTSQAPPPFWWTLRVPLAYREGFGPADFRQVRHLRTY